jgi:hypothetical protein
MDPLDHEIWELIGDQNGPPTETWRWSLTDYETTNDSNSDNDMDKYDDDDEPAAKNRRIDNNAMGAEGDEKPKPNKLRRLGTFVEETGKYIRKCIMIPLEDINHNAEPKEIQGGSAVEQRGINAPGCPSSSSSSA